MSAFGSPSADIRNRMLAGGGPPPRIQAQQLQAPGAAAFSFVAQPVGPIEIVQQNNDLEQLSRILGFTAQTFGIVGQQANEASRAERGAATRFAAEQWPALEAKVLDRTLLPPDGADTTAWAAAIADGLAPENASAPFRSELRSRLAPALDEAALRQQRLMKAEAKDQLVGNLGDSLAGQRDPTAFDEALSEAVAFGIPKEQAISALGTGAAAWAAEAGDQEAWNAAKTFLGGRNALKVEALQGRFEESVRQRDTQTRREADASLSATLLRVRDPATGATFNDARAQVRALAKEAGPQWELDRLQGIDQAEAQQRNAISVEEAKAYDRQIELDITTGAVAASFNTDMGVGLAGIPEEGFTWTNPRGVDRTLTQKELLRNVQRQAFARIEQETQDPAQRFARQAQWLGANGQTSGEWKAVMEAGAAGAAQLVLRRTEKDIVPKDIPRTVVDGYELSKRLRAVDPALRNRHLSRETAEFYDRAEVAELFTDRGDPQAALARAAVLPETQGREPISDRDLDDSVRFARGSINEQDVRAHVGQVADLFMRSPGLGKKAALAEASRIVESQYTPIRGAMVWTGNAAVPTNIGAIAETVAERYANMVSGTAFEVDADDLTLVPLNDGETWVLFEAPRNRPVRFWRYGYVMTNGELRALDAKAAAAAEPQRKQELDAAWELARPDRAETLDGRIAAIDTEIANAMFEMSSDTEIGIPSGQAWIQLSTLRATRSRLIEIKKARASDPLTTP